MAVMPMFGITFHRKGEQMPIQRKDKGCWIWIAALLAGGALSSSAQAQKIYAQQLVDEALAKHPEVIVLAMHVTPPNKPENEIIASNIGRIGKKADADDLRVIRTGKPNLEINKTGEHYEVELTLQDASRKTIGALGVVFKCQKGKEKYYLKDAIAVRNELREKIPTLNKLFEAGS
jgi:hypothetical protein